MGDEVVEARLPEAVVFHPHSLQVQVHRDELEARAEAEYDRVLSDKSAHRP